MAQEGYGGALCRIDQVLQKLKECSAELNEIERIVTQLKTNAHSSSDDIDAIFQPDVRPDPLLVAGTLQELVKALKTGLEGIPELQEVQMASPGINSTEEDKTRSKRISLATQAEANKVCRNSSSESRVAKQAAWSSPGVCRHTCIHHPEMIDPGLWSKLSEDLVGLVFARLPIPRIIELRKCSKAWSAMSESSSFKGAFVEANPNLFGLLGWDSELENFRTRMFDIKSWEWHGFELEFPKKQGYIDSWYACDGGLVCFVPEWEDDEDDWEPPGYSVFVCNPLTNSWKLLPDISLGKKDPMMVQLVTDVDVSSYRVMLVSSEKFKNQNGQILEILGADVYDSRTGLWSTMDSGFVYGTGNTLLGDRNDPLLFDCTTKKLFNLDSCHALQDLMALRYSILKDRLFVLHVLIKPNSYDSSEQDSSEMFVISEYTWESSTSDLRKLNDYESTLRGPEMGSYVGRHNVEISTSTGFILSTWDNLAEDGSVRQLIRLYDISANQWHDLPPMVGDPGTRNEKLEGVFMCELRWDVTP